MVKHGKWRLLGLALLVSLVAACQQTQKRSEPEVKKPVAKVERTQPEVQPKVQPKVEPIRRTPMSTTGFRTSRAYPTGERSTSAVLIERLAPDEVQAGSPFSYTVKVTNLTGYPLEEVLITEILADGYEMDRADPKPTKTTPNPTWMLGTLSARQSKTIRIDGTANATGSIKNCNEVDWASRLCTTTKVVKPALALRLSGPASVISCDPIPYKVVVTNNGTGTARDVVVECRMPDGVRTTDGRTVVRNTVGNLDAGQSREFSLNAKADRDGTFEKSCTATAAGGLKTSSNKVSTVVKTPALSIEKTGPARSFAGRPMKYKITLKNTSDITATSVVLEDMLPAGSRFVSATGNGRAAGGKVVWNLGTLASGQSREFEIVATAVSAGTLRNTATAKAYCVKPVSDTVETVVSGIPAILLEVIDLDDPIAVGDVETYEIRATNQGSAPGTGIKIVVKLEDTMEFISAGGATTATRSGNTVTFSPLRSLAAKDKAVWVVKVKAVGEGDVRFGVEMTSDQLTRPVNETESTNFYK